MSNVTVSEIVEVVSALSIKKIARWAVKWYLLLQVVQFILALAVITFFALVYPQKVLDFTQHGIMPWEEVYDDTQD